MSDQPTWNTDDPAFRDAPSFGLVSDKKTQRIHVYFRGQPSNHFSLSAEEAKAMIRGLQCQLEILAEPWIDSEAARKFVNEPASPGNPLDGHWCQ